MAISLTDILEGVAGQNSILQKVIETTGEITSQLGKLGEKEKQANEAIAVTDGIVQAELDAEMQRDQLANAGFASSVGTNPNDSSTYRQIELGNFLNEKYNQAQEVLAEIEQNATVGFFQDPVRWLQGKLTDGSDRARYEAIRTQYNTAEAQLTTINAATQTVVQTNNALESTATAAVLKARQDKFKLAAQKASVEIDIRTAKYNIDGAERLASMSQQQLANNQSAFQTQEMVKQRKLMEEDRAEALRLRREAAEERRRKGEEDSDTVRIIRNGLAIMGFSDSPMMRLPDQRLLERLLLKEKQVPEIAAAFQIGQRLEFDGKKVLGNTVTDTARLIGQYNLPVTPAQEPVKNLMRQSVSAVQNWNSNPANAGRQINLKDPASVNMAIAATVENQAAANMSLIKPGDATNIYQAPTMNDIAALPGIQNDRLYQKILKPQIETGMKITDPQRIVELAREGISKGDITFNDATRGIHLWFNAAAKVNAVTKDYERFNLPEQSKYVTPIHTGVSTDNVDLMDYGSVAKIVSKSVSSSVLEKGKSVLDSARFVNYLNPISLASDRYIQEMFPDLEAQETERRKKEGGIK